MFGLRPPGLEFRNCVWRIVSSQSSHHPQEVLLAQFSLYVHKGGLTPDSFHFNFAQGNALRASHIIKRTLGDPTKRYVHPMLVQCWPTVCDIVPTLTERLGFSGGLFWYPSHKHETMLVQCRPTIYQASIRPTVGQHLLFSSLSIKAVDCDNTDRHFVSTASCVKTTLALPTKKLGCNEIETNISGASEYRPFSAGLNF